MPTLNEFMKTLVNIDEDIDYIVIDIREELVGYLSFDKYHECVVKSFIDVDVDINRAKVIEVCFLSDVKAVTIMIDAVVIYV